MALFFAAPPVDRSGDLVRAARASSSNTIGDGGEAIVLVGLALVFAFFVPPIFIREPVVLFPRKRR